MIAARWSWRGMSPRRALGRLETVTAGAVVAANQFDLWILRRHERYLGLCLGQSGTSVRPRDRIRSQFGTVAHQEVVKHKRERLVETSGNRGCSPSGLGWGYLDY